MTNERSVGQLTSPAEHAVSADDDDRDGHDARERLHHHARHGAHPAVGDHRVEVEPALRQADLGVSLLAPVGLDDPDAAQDLEDDVREGIAQLARLVGPSQDALGEGEDGDRRAGHHHQRPERDPGVERDRAGEEADEEGRLEDDVGERAHREPEMGHVLAHRQEDVGVALAIEERDREREQMADQALEHPQLDHLPDVELRDDVAEVAEAGGELAEEQDGAEPEQRGLGPDRRRQAPDHPRARAAADRAGEEALDEQDHQRRGQRAADRRGEEAEQEPLLVTEELRDLVPAGDHGRLHRRRVHRAAHAGPLLDW